MSCAVAGDDVVVGAGPLCAGAAWSACEPGTVFDGRAGTPTSPAVEDLVPAITRVAAGVSAAGVVRAVRLEPGRVGDSVREGDSDAVDDEMDASESPGSAQAMTGLPATAAPTPRAAANTPTRPT